MCLLFAFSTVSSSNTGPYGSTLLSDFSCQSLWEQNSPTSTALFQSSVHQFAFQRLHERTADVLDDAHIDWGRWMYGRWAPAQNYMAKCPMFRFGLTVPILQLLIQKISTVSLVYLDWTFFCWFIWSGCLKLMDAWRIFNPDFAMYLKRVLKHYSVCLAQWRRVKIVCEELLCDGHLMKNQWEHNKLTN